MRKIKPSCLVCNRYFISFMMVNNNNKNHSIHVETCAHFIKNLCHYKMVWFEFLMIDQGRKEKKERKTK